MHYLQVYLVKVASFLNYCSFLMAVSKDHTVTEMLDLDSELQGYSVANLEMNWSQDNFKVIDIRNNFLQESSKSSKGKWGAFSQGVGKNPSPMVKVLTPVGMVSPPGVVEPVLKVHMVMVVVGQLLRLKFVTATIKVCVQVSVVTVNMCVIVVI